MLGRLRAMGALPTAEVTDLASAAAVGAMDGRDGSRPRKDPAALVGSRGEAR